MTRTRAALALVVPLLLTPAGCAVVDRVKDAADTVQALTAMADALKGGAAHAYTAVYRTSTGGRVEVAHDPPRAAYRGPYGTYITSDEFRLLCQRGGCQKAPPYASADVAPLAAVTGPAFIAPTYAVGVLAAAALYPATSVSQSQTTIAGRAAECVRTRGLASAAEAAGAERAEDFTLCVTEDGVLGSFDGMLPSGERGEVTLTAYSAGAQPTLFTVPAEVRVTEVRQLVLP